MIWIEARKAVRSRMPLWTALGSMFMPLGIAFLIFVARNPEISRKIGLISAKADLVAYSATDWPAYLNFFGQLVAAGGFLLSVLITSWVFGREFSDSTLKDLLAVPVPRTSILLAKFIVVAAWSAGLVAVMFAAALAMGALMKLPGGSAGILLQGALTIAVAACLAIVCVLPFAFFAGVGRGYLLPVGAALLTLMMTNLVAIVGWGEYFPFAVPGLYAQGETPLGPASYASVLLTGLAGVAATCLWWTYADQNR